MKRIGVVAALLVLTAAPAAAAPAGELTRWRAEARRVQIVRDDWGIAHVRGRRDADAVFGMVYAQAEDDFNRVETNYINALGRLAEAEGEGAVWQDLRMKLFIDPAELRARYATSPAWLKALMDAWADGLNYYLATHPQVRPRVITRFEPWMALSFSEGSIGGDIERVSLKELEAFYGRQAAGGQALLPCPRDRPQAGPRINSAGEGDRGAVEGAAGARRLERSAGSKSGASRPCGGRPLHHASRGPPPPLCRGGELAAADDPDWRKEPGGSNGIAIAPANTVDGHALLLINPHTSFFFRSELQMTSEEGLNAYGAATWGQFFIYQGFNPHAGWMHTSSGVDVVDEFAETVTRQGGRLVYRYGSEARPVQVSQVAVPYRRPDGSMAARRFTVYRTHHGPVVREAGGKWIATALMQKPVEALSQSFLRTKAIDYAAFMKVAGLKANSSNNTIFADDKGEIAYLHPQFIPRRDDRFDYTRPVDGADPATDWKGLHALAEAPHLLNPPNGWIFNTNDWPYSAAGPYSPRREAYPRYMDTVGENPRGLHAALLLSGRRGWSLEALNRAAYDSYLTAFARLIPRLLQAYDAAPESNPLKPRLREQIAVLRSWDARWGLDSVPTSLAVFWGELLMAQSADAAKAAGVSVYDWMADRTSGEQKLRALADASDRLTHDFGSWRTPWGQINRFQRLSADIAPSFSDAGPSLPVPFTSAQWGSLASFGARRYPGTTRYYGTSGNSFVAVVEFGPRVRAVAVTAGGESGHPGSPHFTDQARRYASGELREVYFYPEQLTGHTERRYHPGD